MTASYRSHAAADPPREQLREQGKVALDVLERLLEGCQVIGFDYTYCYVNPTVAAQGHRTREQLLGRTMMECYPGIEQTPMFAQLRRCMTDRTHRRMENEFTYPDGTIGWFELQFVPVPEGTYILSLDVTERKRAQAALGRTEDQLRHAQKMEAIGRLAGSVAHDFNNMLSVIISYAGLTLESLTPGDPRRDDVQEIQKAGHRASELTKQLLSFSRHQVLAPKLIDLNDVVTGVEKMLRRLIGDDVRLNVLLTPSVGRVKADPGHIDQILMNLAINARDAMPDGGTLTVETGYVELDETYAREHLGTKPGPHVMIAVSDSGTGMDRKTQDRIFEPFFTTKPAGKGTGLGLSTVFGIVQQSRGSIWVYSELGRGTTFKVYFPLADEAGRGSIVERMDAVPPPADRETILVVEDDGQLRQLIAGLLQRLGYDVLVAEGPDTALRISEQRAEPIHLLLTDVVMPGKYGPTLARELRESRPELKVLFMSGYTGHVAVHRGELEDGAAFLQKPITPAGLSRALQQALHPAN